MTKEEKHDPYFFYVSLKLILENKKGEALGLEMPEDSSMAGYYDVPGGRINANELEMPYEKIIKREVMEEIGKNARYRLTKSPVSISRHPYFSKKLGKEMYIFFVFFKALYLGGKIKTSNEHIGCKWLKLNKNNVSEYFVRGLREGFKNYFQWN